MLTPVDYHLGYPPHPAPKPIGSHPDLVARGYQESDSTNQLIHHLARSDAHKKMAFHPSHTGSNDHDCSRVEYHQQCCLRQAHHRGCTRRC